MYCRVIACDFDGTGAADGRMSPEVAAALGKARAKGYTTLLSYRPGARRDSVDVRRPGAI